MGPIERSPPPTLLCSLLSTCARNSSSSESIASTSSSADAEVWRTSVPDQVHSRPSGLSPETGSRLAGLRMSLLFPPIQPERATVAEVEDCESMWKRIDWDYSPQTVTATAVRKWGASSRAP